MTERALGILAAVIGAFDNLVTSPGPGVSFALAMVCGVAGAQFLKFPLSWYVEDDRRFSWLVRALSVVITIIFAHTFSDALNLPLEVLAGLCSVGFYHVSLAVIRRRAPWLETKAFVGSVEPPMSAVLAAQRRAMDRAEDGQDSGA